MSVHSGVRQTDSDTDDYEAVISYTQISCNVETPQPLPVETKCAAFSATNTQYDSVNYATCFIYACPGATLVADGCNDACEGDTVLILYNSVGSQLVINDDGSSSECGLCSLLSYDTGDAACQVYSLHEGCYADDTCEGQVEVSGGVVTVSQAPSAAPTAPPTFNCPAYQASDTNNDEQNYDTCELYACPGASLQLSGCNSDCVGDQYLRLYSSSSNEQVDYNDDGCGSGPYALCGDIQYVTSEACQVRHQKA